MSVYDKVKQSIDLVEHIGKHIALKQHGNTFKGLCPFHDESDGSLCVYEIDGEWRWKCHGCDAHGDIIDFEKLRLDVIAIKAVQSLSSDYGIDISEFGDLTPEISTEQQVRKLAQQYFVDRFNENAKAQTYVTGRGVSLEECKKWGIGYNDGKIYEYLKDIVKLDDGQTNFDVLVNIGIAGYRKRIVKSILPALKLTIPCIVDGEISHWTLRDVGGPAGGQQMRKEARSPNFNFFNQDDIDRNQSVWITEGPFDVISLARIGVKSVATLGQPTKGQIDSLKRFKGTDPNFAGLNTEKTLTLAFDNDENASGQRFAAHVGHSLAAYHDIRIARLPEKTDIDEYIRKHGNIDDLTVEKFKSLSTVIREDRSGYWIDSGDAPRQLTNFTINRDYVYINDEGDHIYYVHIIGQNGYKKGPVKMEAVDFSTARGFSLWLQTKTYGLFFDGKDKDMVELIKYWGAYHETKQANLVNQYGKINKNTWLFSDGAIIDGEYVPASEDGLIYNEKKDRYLKSSLSKQETMRCSLIDPAEAMTVDEIVKNLFTYYPRSWVIMVIGCAAAMYHHNTIRKRYRDFPVFAMYGPTMAGKTKLASILASLLGAGNLSNPSATSTKIGAERMFASINSMPLIMNEFKSDAFSDLIRDVYDRNQNIKGRKTVDNSVKVAAINTSIIVTCETVPAEESVLNRLIHFDFYNFKKQKSQKIVSGFSRWEADGVIGNGNIGFLYAMAKSAQNDILDDIEYSRDFFIQHDVGVDSRVLYNYSVILGAFRNANRCLGLDKIISDLGIDPIRKEEFIDCFKKSSYLVKKQSRDENPMHKFFEMFERLYYDGEVKNYARMMFPMLRFNLKHVFAKVKEVDNRGSKSLYRTQQKDIAAAIKNHFGVKSARGYIDRPDGSKYQTTVYEICVDDLSELGYTFDADVTLNFEEVK